MKHVRQKIDIVIENGTPVCKKSQSGNWTFMILMSDKDFFAGNNCPSLSIVPCNITAVLGFIVRKLWYSLSIYFNPSKVTDPEWAEIMRLSEDMKGIIFNDIPLCKPSYMANAIFQDSKTINIDDGTLSS